MAGIQRREPIWYEDISVLVWSRNALILLPDERQTREENANAVMRLAIYFSVASALIRQSLFPFAVLFFVAPATYFWYNSVKGSFVEEKKRSLSAKKSKSTKRVVKPTRQNPFMNSFEPDKKDTYFVDPLDAGVSKQIDQKLNDGVFRDADDIYNRKASNRQFYTVPSPRAPNDQAAFANWLYGSVRAGGKFTRPPSNAVY